MEFESEEEEEEEEGDGGGKDRLGATVKTSPGASTSRAVMGEGKVDDGHLGLRADGAEGKEKPRVRRQLSVEVADSNFEPGSARSLVEGDRACPQPGDASFGSLPRLPHFPSPAPPDSGSVAGLGGGRVFGAVLQPLRLGSAQHGRV